MLRFRSCCNHLPNLLDLVPLPTDFHPATSAQAFVNHVRQLHDKIKQKIASSNNHYKLAVNSRRRHKDINVDDYEMI